MSLSLGRRLIDKNNCKTLEEVIDAVNNFHDALDNPVDNPGPGVDGTVPDLYEPVYVDPDGNLTSGAVLTTVKIIAGYTTAAVAGPADFTIDGLVSLTEGFTVPAEPLSVVNTIGLSCGDNTAIYAIYRPDNATWHTWTDTTDSAAAYTAGLGLTVTTGEFALDDTGYNGSDVLLYGAVAAAFQFDTVGGWLERLADYESGTGAIQLVGHNEGDPPVWDTVSGWLTTLGDFDNTTNLTQVIGHDGATEATWFDMASLQVGTVSGAAAKTAASLDGAFWDSCGGHAGPIANEAINNTFGLGFDDSSPVLVVRSADGAIDSSLLIDAGTPSAWHAIASRPVAVAVGLATGPVAFDDPTFTAGTFTSLWGKTPSSTETVDNTFDMECETGDPVWAVRFPGSSTWYAVQMKGVEIEVISEITSMAITGGNLQLNFKKTTVRVPAITVAESSDSITIPVTSC